MLIAASFILSGCQKANTNTDTASSTRGLPAKVKIIYESGISVRENTDSKSAIISAAHKGYEYEVTDGYPAYYRIKFLEGKEGWVSANPADNWTEITAGTQVKINHPSGLRVRTEPYKKGDDIGAAVSGYSFDLLSAEYSHLKIKLPDNKTGWIYIGNPEQRWVEFLH